MEQGVSPGRRYPRFTVRIDSDAEWPRFFCRHGYQIEFAARNFESADEVAIFRGKPDVAISIERKRARLFRFPVRYFELRRATGGRIEIADVPSPLTRVPQVSLIIDEQCNGLRTLTQVVTIEFFGIPGEIADVVAAGADERNGAAHAYEAQSVRWRVHVHEPRVG